MCPFEGFVVSHRSVYEVENVSSYDKHRYARNAKEENKVTIVPRS